MPRQHRAARGLAVDGTVMVLSTVCCSALVSAGRCASAAAESVSMLLSYGLHSWTYRVLSLPLKPAPCCWRPR